MRFLQNILILLFGNSLCQGKNSFNIDENVTQPAPVQQPLANLSQADEDAIRLMISDALDQGIQKLKDGFKQKFEEKYNLNQPVDETAAGGYYCYYDDYGNYVCY